MAAGAALAGALFFAFAIPSRGIAVDERGPSLTGTATELGSITGGPVEIHATSVIASDRALPLVCKTLVEAFQEAANDPVTKKELGQIVHVIVIEGWIAGAESHHVKLKDQVMTIQTLTGPGDIQDLHPLIVEVLKKVAHLDARHEQ
jgi:hypothetical protein